MSLSILPKDELFSPKFKEGVLLLVDKPLEWTSFDVVKKLRYKICRSLGIKKLKVGHAGTLDPLATGLLLICTGKYTKQIDSLQAQIKGYSGVITLGGTTPSYDLEKEVENIISTKHLTQDDVLNVTKKFIGTIEQTPPVFSALKMKGERLFHKARRGEIVDVPKRTIQINSFNIRTNELPKVPFKVECSKGTYIRSLAHEFGQELGVGGYLSELRRTYIGDYHVDDAWKMDELIDYIENRFENTEVCQ